MKRAEDEAVDRARLEVVLGPGAPRYLTVAKAARASGFSLRAVYRAIDRGELAAGVVCSRLRARPDDFLAWMEGSRAAATAGRAVATGSAYARRRQPDGLRGLLTKRSLAA